MSGERGQMSVIQVQALPISGINLSTFNPCSKANYDATAEQSKSEKELEQLEEKYQRAQKSLADVKASDAEQDQQNMKEYEKAAQAVKKYNATVDKFLVAKRDFFKRMKPDVPSAPIGVTLCTTADKIKKNTAEINKKIQALKEKLDRANADDKKARSLDHPNTHLRHLTQCMNTLTGRMASVIGTLDGLKGPANLVFGDAQDAFQTSSNRNKFDEKKFKKMNESDVMVRENNLWRVVINRDFKALFSENAPLVGNVDMQPNELAALT